MDQNHQVILRKAIELINDNGLYQKRIIGIMSLAWIIITYGVMINSFVFMNPLFICQQNSQIETLACKDLSKCHIFNDFTGTVHAQLYCEQKQIRSFIQSLFPIGCLVGVIYFSILNDKKGRRYSSLLCTITGTVGIILLYIGILKKLFYLIAFGQIFTGIFSSAAANISYIITGQIGSATLRQRAIMIYSAVWGACQISFLLVQKYIKNWKQYLIQLNLLPTLILLILVYSYVLQTPSFYLLNKKDKNKAISSLEKIGKINQVDPDDIKQSIRQIINIQTQKMNVQVKQQIKSQGLFHKIFNLFINKHQRKCILLLGMISMGFNAFYYCLLSSFQRNGYSFGFNAFLVGIHQFVGYCIIGYFITQIKRKTGLFIVNTFISFLGLLFMLPIITMSPLMQSLLISLCSLSFVCTFSLAQMLNMQSFGPQVKSTAVGMIAAISQISRFFIPYILLFLTDFQVNPIVIVSIIFSLLSIFPLFFIQQTLPVEIKSLQLKRKEE